MKKNLFILSFLLFVLFSANIDIYADENPLRGYDIRWVDQEYDKVDPFIDGYALGYKEYDKKEYYFPIIENHYLIDYNGITTVQNSDEYDRYAGDMITNCVGAKDSNYRNDLIAMFSSNPTSPWDYNAHLIADGSPEYSCGSYLLTFDKNDGTLYNTDGKKINNKKVLGFFVTYDDLILVQLEDENHETPELYLPFTCYNKNGDVIIKEVDPETNTTAIAGDSKYLPFAERPSVWKDLGNGQYEPYDDSTYDKASNDSYKLILPFNDGLTSQKDDSGKYGVLDRNAKVIVPYVLDEAAFFNESYAIIKYKGKYGVMKDPRKDSEKQDLNSLGMAKELQSLGLFEGISSKKFSPDLGNYVMSYEAITIIGRALKWDVDKNAKSTFIDVPDYAVPYTEYARKHGITSGISDNQFGMEVDGRRIFTWFLAALGENKNDVWLNTEKYAKKYDIPVPKTNKCMRNDVVHLIYDGIRHPMVGEDKTLLEKIKENQIKTLPDLPREFEYSIPIGGIFTRIVVYEDLSFKGSFMDEDFGNKGDDNPKGTVWLASFSGKFKNPQKINDYKYSIQLDEFSMDIEKEDRVVNGLLEVWNRTGYPRGLENPYKFYYYLSNSPISEFDPANQNWSKTAEEIKKGYALFNITEQTGFTGTNSNNTKIED